MKYIPRFGMMYVLLHLQYELYTAQGMKCIPCRFIPYIGMKIFKMKIILLWYEVHTTVFAVY